MTQQRVQRADFGPTWPEVAGFGEPPQQADLRDCGHSHIACSFVKFVFSLLCSSKFEINLSIECIITYVYIMMQIVNSDREVKWI